MVPRPVVCVGHHVTRSNSCPGSRNARLIYVCCPVGKNARSVGGKSAHDSFSREPTASPIESDAMTESRYRCQLSDSFHRFTYRRNGGLKPGAISKPEERFLVHSLLGMTGFACNFCRFCVRLPVYVLTSAMVPICLFPAVFPQCVHFLPFFASGLSIDAYNASALRYCASDGCFCPQDRD
jgi:hypothetical protein